MGEELIKLCQVNHDVRCTQTKHKASLQVIEIVLQACTHVYLASHTTYEVVVDCTKLW